LPAGRPSEAPWLRWFAMATLELKNLHVALEDGTEIV
jgi:hypothetical protein